MIIIKPKVVATPDIARRGPSRYLMPSAQSSSNWKLFSFLRYDRFPFTVSVHVEYLDPTKAWERTQSSCSTIETK